MTGWWLAFGTAAAGDLPRQLEVTDEVHLTFGGYIDLGWFDAAGDGVAYDSYPGWAERPDVADRDAGWVFWGDPWANAVNSQGDSADLGRDRTNLPRADAIASGGRPTFLVNTIAQTLTLTAGERFFAFTAIDLEPRGGDFGDLGDEISAERAYLAWHPLARSDLRVAFGKIESVFGIEYRTERAPERPGITPSLVARYTTGTPVGVQLRGSVWGRSLSVAASLTNGSTSTEKFGHFSDESDRNGMPTGTVRVAGRTRGAVRLEVGASGQVGAEDGQPDPTVPMAQVGADLQIEVTNIWLRAEAVVSDQDQGPAGTDSLHARGGYVELSSHVLPWFAPLVRMDRRVADLRTGPNQYLSDVLRVTAGVRFDVTYNLIGKVEFLHLVELEGDPINDDVATASMVFRY